MATPLGLLQRLRTQIQKNNPALIREQLERAAPFDAAWCLGRLPVEERVRVLGMVPPDLGAKIFQEIPLDKQLEMLALGRLPSLVSLIRHLDSDKLADLLGALEPIDKEIWLATLPSQELSETQSLLAYGADTAGGLMAKEYVTVPVHLTAGEVSSRLQALAADYESLKVTYVYVIDDKGILAGVLPLRDLLFKPRETPVSQIMLRDIVTLPVTASKREVAELFRQRNLLALPVVTWDKKMAGVITGDDVMDVIQELAHEEVLKLAQVSKEESRDGSLWFSIKGRLSWLTINIFLNLISASVIAFHEDTLSAVIALAFFLPIISDMGGAAGMQAVAVSIRDLAMQKILPRDYARVLRQELVIGFLNGILLGVILGTVTYFLRDIPMLGVVVALSLWINTVIAVAIGGVLPLVIKYVRSDPAIISGPILTTITDMTGFFILLSLASYWLPLLKPVP